MSSDLSSQAVMQEDERHPGLPLGRILLGLLALGALWLVARHAGEAIPRFAAWIDGLGFWAPAIFVAAYAASIVALVLRRGRMRMQ